MPTDAVSIRVLTDAGLKTFRRRALEIYLDPASSRSRQLIASRQMLAAQDEAARRRLVTAP